MKNFSHPRGECLPPLDGSDSQSVTPQPMPTMSARELRDSTLNLKTTVRDLRGQLKQIRKLQLNMVGQSKA